MTVLSVERTEEAIVIKLPLDASAEYIQNMLNYVAYVQDGSESKVTQEQIDALAKEGKSGWWAKNRERFEGVAGFEDLPK